MTDSTFIQSINLRYQALFGRVTASALVVWLGVVVVFVLGTDAAAHWTAFFVIGTLLLALFAMRLMVFVKGKTLYAETRTFATPLESLITQARSMDPEPIYFLSLVEGPLSAKHSPTHE